MFCRSDSSFFILFSFKKIYSIINNKTNPSRLKKNYSFACGFVDDVSCQLFNFLQRNILLSFFFWGEY